MDSKTMWQILPLLIGLLPSPLAVLQAADAPAKQPNIVFIYSDDQTQRALGSVGRYFSIPLMDHLEKKCGL